MRKDDSFTGKIIDLDRWEGGDAPNIRVSYQPLISPSINPY